MADVFPCLASNDSCLPHHSKCIWVHPLACVSCFSCFTLATIAGLKLSFFDFVPPSQTDVVGIDNRMCFIRARLSPSVRLTLKFLSSYISSLYFIACLTMHSILLRPPHIPSPRTLCAETSWLLTWLQRQVHLWFIKLHIFLPPLTPLSCNGARTSIYHLLNLTLHLGLNVRCVVYSSTPWSIRPSL